MTYTCQECGEECKSHTVNMGIGSYEFWGAKGNDVRMETVSLCCDAPLLDEDGREADVEEDERLNHADRVADERRDRELDWDRGVGS